MIRSPIIPIKSNKPNKLKAPPPLFELAPLVAMEEDCAELATTKELLAELADELARELTDETLLDDELTLLDELIELDELTLLIELDELLAPLHSNVIAWVVAASISI